MPLLVVCVSALKNRRGPSDRSAQGASGSCRSWGYAVGRECRLTLNDGRLEMARLYVSPVVEARLLAVAMIPVREHMSSVN